jgi:hypothetical protein
MGYGRKKGGAFENLICKDIVKAFKVAPQDCYRSVQSGAHKDSFGDISMSSRLAKRFPFSPELKFYKEIDYSALHLSWKKLNKSCVFISWWKQTLRGAEKCGRAPILIFKSNNRPVMCIVPMEAIPLELVKLRTERLPETILRWPMVNGKRDKVFVTQWLPFLKFSAELRRKK